MAKKETPFKKGNQLWQLRSKHGRNKLFETPELLWEAACEYFKYIDENPFMEIDYRGKDAIKVEIPKRRPYTLGGLAIYLDCSTEYLRHFEGNNKDSEDFMPIITRIKEIIRTQKFEGAASGFFNANIIARDLGLRDNHDNTSNGQTIMLINGKELPDEEDK